jgi:hypothetical protein
VSSLVPMCSVLPVGFRSDNGRCRVESAPSQIHNLGKGDDLLT